MAHLHLAPLFPNSLQRLIVLDIVTKVPKEPDMNGGNELTFTNRHLRERRRSHFGLTNGHLPSSSVLLAPPFVRSSLCRECSSNKRTSTKHDPDIHRWSEEALWAVAEVRVLCSTQRAWLRSVFVQCYLGSRVAYDRLVLATCAARLRASQGTVVW